jgi:hypothetical protein
MVDAWPAHPRAERNADLQSQRSKITETPGKMTHSQANGARHAFTSQPTLTVRRTTAKRAPNRQALAHKRLGPGSRSSIGRTDQSRPEQLGVRRFRRLPMRQQPSVPQTGKLPHTNDFDSAVVRQSAEPMGRGRVDDRCSRGEIDLCGSAVVRIEGLPSPHGKTAETPYSKLGHPMPAKIDVTPFVLSMSSISQATSPHRCFSFRCFPVTVEWVAIALVMR